MVHYNITPLAFYTDLNDQNHRLSYAENRSFALFSPARSFLPFQIISNNKALSITSVWLFDFNDSEVVFSQNLTNYFQSNISFITKPDYNVLVYNSANSLSSDLQEGCYYLRIVTNQETFYSELFMSKKNLRAFINKFGFYIILLICLGIIATTAFLTQGKRQEGDIAGENSNDGISSEAAVEDGTNTNIDISITDVTDPEPSGESPSEPPASSNPG